MTYCFCHLTLSVLLVVLISQDWRTGYSVLAYRAYGTSVPTDWYWACKYIGSVEKRWG